MRSFLPSVHSFLPFALLFSTAALACSAADPLQQEQPLPLPLPPDPAPCPAGSTRTEQGCIDPSPCSLEHPSGQCPLGSLCDPGLGYCAPDPSLPCLTLWEVDGGSAETPLCSALHSPEFLKSRTGDGQAHDRYLLHFDEMWRSLDEGYGAFDAAQVDWNAIKAKYRPSAERAASRYEQLELLVRLFGELRDSHVGYIDRAACDDGTAMSVFASPFQFKTTLVDGEVVVYDSQDERVRPGDRVLSINGLSGPTLRTYYNERVKCGSGNSSSSAADTEFGTSATALAADRIFVGSKYEPLLGVVIEDSQGRRILLRPDTSVAPARWSSMDFYAVGYGSGAGQIRLNWKEYSTGQWGGNMPGYIGHALVDGIAYMVLHDFMGEDELAEALRYVVQLYPKATGWIIDTRINYGGGPHEDTLASFFLDQPITLMKTELKAGPAHDAFEPCTNCSSMLYPDPTIHIGVPVAVLTSGMTVSAGDYFAYKMRKAPRARLFGQPSNGAFGNISVHELNPTVSYHFTWTRVSDVGGTWSQGRSIQPHELLWFNRAALRAGVDTVLRRAQEWIVIAR